MDNITASHLEFLSKNRILDFIYSKNYNLVIELNEANVSEARTRINDRERLERAVNHGVDVGNTGYPDDRAGRILVEGGRPELEPTGTEGRAGRAFDVEEEGTGLSIPSLMLVSSSKTLDKDGSQDALFKPDSNEAVPSLEAIAPALDDFVLTDDILSESRSLRQKAEDNIAALELLRAIERNPRQPTHDERISLARYVGWGGLPHAFRHADGQIAQGWDDIVTKLEGLLTARELRSARASTLDAHYTSHDVIQAIYAGVQATGIQPRKILEPSCGVGNFLGLSPYDQSLFEATEIDPVTAGIAKILYPKANILATGFNQALHGLKPTYDVVVGNPPFGKARIFDAINTELTDKSPNTHSYFFNKALEKTAAGGVIAMVVSRYLMDSKLGVNVRMNMARQAELIAAFRLPDTAFKENAGTDVVTDILFLQKRHEIIAEDDEDFTKNPPAWTKVSTVFIDNKNTQATVAHDINVYFIDHPNNIMGVHYIGRGMYSENDYNVSPIDDWQAKLFEKTSKIKPVFDLPDASKTLFSDFSKTSSNDYKDYPVFSGKAKHGEFILVQNQDKTASFLGVYQDNISDAQRALGYTPVVIEQGRASDNDIDDNEDASDFELNKAAFERLVAYVPIKDALKSLVDRQVSEREESDEMRADREALNIHYKAFVDKFGLLNRPYNMRHILNDVYGARVLSLETDYKKAITPAMSKKTGEAVREESCTLSPIFTSRTQYPPLDNPEHADSAEQALAYSLNFKGCVDTAYMSKLLNRAWDGIREELGERIVYTENGFKETSIYVTGDVVEKMETLKRWAETTPYAQSHEIDRTLSMLQSSLPEPKKIENITVLPGAHWAPLSIHHAFIDECFGEGLLKINPINELGSWVVETTSKLSRPSEFTTERMPAKNMAWHFLMNKTPTIMDTIKHADGTTTMQLNAPETELARSKMDALNEKWATWIVDPERAEDIERAHNKVFNRFAKIRPSMVEHLTFPGLSTSIVIPRPTQKMGAMAIINNKSTLLDHAVGAGKTITAILAIMEARRLGLSKKPMITCPNGLEIQYVKAFADTYPSANVLVASKKDMSKNNRQKFLSRVAMDDTLDCVIIPHSSYSLIPRDPDFDIQFIESELERYRAALSTTISLEAGNSKKSSSVKKIEAKIKALEFKLNTKVANLASAKDSGIHFGNIGFDFVSTDESQMFKNIPFLTSMRNIRGLGNPEGSARALDSLLKARFVIESGGRYVDMSGTPESNTLAEVYLSMAKLIPDTLKSMGIHHFDQWVATFARKTSEFQYSLTGAYKETSYLNQFVNMSSLRAILSTFRHTITIEDVQRMALESGAGEIKLPKLKDGQPKIIAVEKTKIQNEIIGYQVDVNENGDPIYNEGSIMHGLASIAGKQPEPGAPNVLSYIGELRKAGLSSKAWDANIDDRSPKLEACADEIWKLYQEYNEDLGTQIVFLDMSTPKKKGKPSKEALQVRRWVADIERGESEDATEKDIEARALAEEALSEYSPSEIDDFLSDESSWSAYDELRELAAERGIPKSEFAFVHEYDTLEKREELFGKVRSGQVRVIMGSTSLMGAGVNIQDRLVGMQMLDAPWRPDQMLQRIGRMLRQGNLLLEKYGDAFKVALNYFVTEGSVDAAMYQINANKLTFINAIRDVNGGETVSDASFDPMAISVAASGNLVLQFNEVVKKAFKKLKNLHHASQGETLSRQRTQDRAQKAIDYFNANHVVIKKVIDEYNDLKASRNVRQAENEAIQHQIEEEKSRLKMAANVDKENVRDVLSSREEWKTWSKNEKDEAIRKEKQLINKKLEADIQALGHAPSGWMDIKKNDTVIKNITMNALGNDVISQAIGLIQRKRSATIPLFSIGGFDYTLEVSTGFSRDYIADVVCVHGDFPDVEERYKIPSMPTMLSASQITNAGLSIAGLPRRVAEACYDLYQQSESAKKTLEVMRNQKKTGANTSDVLSQIEFLDESQEALKAMLRCGLSKTHDAVEMVNHLIHGTADSVDEESRIYKIINNKAYVELAQTWLVPREHIVTYWDKHGEKLIDDINERRIPKMDDIYTSMQSNGFDLAQC